MLDLIPAGPQRLDRARGLAAARGRRALRLRRRAPTGSTSGRPSATCRARSTSSRATSRTAVAERLGRRLPGRRRRACEADGRIVPPALVERGCAIAAGAHVGSLVVLGEGVTVGEGAIDRALGRAQRRRDRRATACCATASSPPACASARAREISGGAVLGEGVTVGARQRPRRAACESSRRRTCPKAPSRSEEGEADRVQHRAARARPRDDRPGRSDRPAHRRPRDPRAPARRAVEGGVGRPGAVGLARRPRRRGHGRLGHRRRAWPARSSATTPRARCSARAPTACRRGRRPTPPSCARRYSGNTEETLACYEAAGVDRRAARRRHERRQARRAGARRRRARSSRSPAASSRAPRSPT